MGSVVVSWSGRLDDRECREALCARLATIATASHSYFDPTPPLRTYDQVYKGRIIVEATVFDAGQDLSELTRLYKHTGHMPFKLGTPMQPEPVEIEADLFAASEVTLHGLDFRLYDGRGLYDDRVSFVFARFPEYWGYRLVAVSDRAACQRTGHEILSTGDLFLSSPRLHMRYYCETWMDRFLAWIKYFYVPDLVFWRYDLLPGYDQFAEEMTAGVERAAMEESALADLVGQFRQEVAAWQATASDAKQFWSAVRGEGA